MSRRVIGRSRVLLLEDDRDLAQLGAMALETSGLDVRVAHSVEEAIAACGAQVPDAAIVDLQLSGRNGWDFVRYARTGFPGLRLLIYSVHDDARGSGSADLAVDAYLTKDIAPDELATSVRRLLRSRRSGDG